MKKKCLVISDVDGCLTDGTFVYTGDGKVAKTFGAHDNDGVKMLINNDVDVEFITADRRGFGITKKRVADDMGCKLTLVGEWERGDYLKEKFKSGEYEYYVFFGDGIFDMKAFVYADENCSPANLFIAPNNAVDRAKDFAEYVTRRNGGDGAYFEMSCYVIQNILGNC